MGNLPFERTRYNPVRDVTPDEAEQDKRRQSEQEAALNKTKTEEQEVPSADSEDASGKGEK